MLSQAVRARQRGSYRLLNAGLRGPVRLGAVLLALVLIGLRVDAQPAHPAELTTVRAIRHVQQPLLPQTPVHIRGVVTYFDTVAPNLFVQDATGGIWVDLRGLKVAPPLPGDELDLRGTVGSGFSPYIASPQWKVIGKGSAPRPARLSYEEAATASFDSQWVQIDAVVRSFVQQAEGNVLVIDVATPTGAFKVRVPDYHDSFPMNLVDAKVRFTGVCAAAFNSRNQFVSFHLMMPSLKNLEVLDPAPADPFAIPATPIASIRRYSADLADERRVKVMGTVTAIFPLQGIYMTDATGGLYAESQDGTPMREGDQLEVIGFAAAGSFSPVLRSARIRPTGKHFVPTTSSVNGKSALKGSYDAQLVNIQGTLKYYREHLNRRVLVIESADHVTFEAAFARQPSQTADIEPGESRGADRRMRSSSG